ncbi:translocation protein S66, partial [Modicella reniformis]
INDADPWFPENEALSKYIALLQQEEPEATETQLKSALLRRAIEAVTRIFTLREDKPVLAGLVKQGTVGDDTWMEFTLSEKELELEIMAIIAEANTFKEGWGQTILQTASEMVIHERTKNMEKEMKAKKEEDERNQALQEKLQEENKVQEEKNMEERQERERAKALEELLAEEAAEMKKASQGSKKPKRPTKK